MEDDFLHSEEEEGGEEELKIPSDIDSADVDEDLESIDDLADEEDEEDEESFDDENPL